MPTSAEERALVSAIGADPWSTEPALAYAEWLESRDPARAELIRLEVEASPLEWDDPRREEIEKRTWQLDSEHGDRWFEPIEPLLGGDAHMRLGVLDTLDCENVTDGALATLAEVPALRVLFLDGGEFTAEGLQHVASLPNLAQLRLGDVTISDDGWEALVNLPCWTIVCDWGKTYDRKALTSMEKRRLARIADLSEEELVAAGRRYADAVAHPMHPSNSLDFGLVTVRDEHLQLLGAVPGIEELSFYEAKYLTADGLKPLARLGCLRTLSLAETGVSKLTHLRGCSSLRELIFTAPFRESLGDNATEGLESLTNIERLQLENVELGPGTVERLKSLPKLQLLEATVAPDVLEDLRSVLPDLEIGH